MANLSFFDDTTTLIPGPSFHIDLAALDARHPVHYSRRLLIFQCASPAQREAQLAAFKAGLKALVLHCPILGGTIAPLPLGTTTDGQEDWRTIVPGPGIELVVRDLRKSIASFEELEADNFSPVNLPYDLLVPIPKDIDNGLPFAACKVQFSTIERGTIFTFSMSHSVADGSGTNELMHILSKEVRLADEPSRGAAVNVNENRVGLGQDRGVLRSITSEAAFDIKDHPAFRWKSKSTNPPVTAPLLPEEPPIHHPFEATSPEIPVLLRISCAGLAQLKADATLPGAAPLISTHDALCALIWRSVLLIRSQRYASVPQRLPASTLVNLFMPSDARRHLDLPASYIGNSVYQLAAVLDLGTLLSPSGLQYAASAVRRAIASVNPALVSSYMTRLKEEWIDWQFMSTASTTGVAMGTDWSSGSLYSDDWGEAFGPVVSFRYPGGVGDAFTCVLPKLPDGGAEVVVAVMPDEVGVLTSDEGFGKYIEAR